LRGQRRGHAWAPRAAVKASTTSLAGQGTAPPKPLSSLPQLSQPPPPLPGMSGDSKDERLVSTASKTPSRSFLRKI